MQFEISQIKKPSDVALFPLYEMHIGKFMEAESVIGGTRSWGRGNGELLFSGDRVQSSGDR